MDMISIKRNGMISANGRYVIKEIHALKKLGRRQALVLLTSVKVTDIMKIVPREMNSMDPGMMEITNLPFQFSPRDDSCRRRSRRATNRLMEKGRFGSILSFIALTLE